MEYIIEIKKATIHDVSDVAEMVGELLHEIMAAINIKVFNFSLSETKLRLRTVIENEQYFVFIARNKDYKAVGFITLYESFSLYAEGAFGTIQELYVRPEYRANELGLRLVNEAKDFAFLRKWKRLEVTTPPLPEFARTLSFYEREGFSISGGRKLKISF